MQAYQDHLAMGKLELLKQDAEEQKKQIQAAFDNGADEIKVFKPTKAQLKNMRMGGIKRRQKAI